MATPTNENVKESSGLIKWNDLQTDFEIHVKSISNLMQSLLTLGEHESEEFRNELKAVSQRTEPALKEVLFLGSNFLSILDAKFVALQSGSNSGSGGLVYRGVKQIILSIKDFLDDPRNIVPVIKNLVNDLQDSFLKFVNAVKSWSTIQAELSNVLKKGSASIKNFIRNKGFSDLVDTAIAKGFSNFLDPKLIAGNSKSKLFNLAVAIITGAGVGNTDGVVSDPQSTQKTIIQNILGAVFGIVGGGALATLIMPAAAGTVAAITIGVLTGIVADLVWEYAVPDSWKQLGTDVLSDIYDHVVAHRTILIKGIESLFPGPTFIIEEVTDSVITYFIEDDRIERKLPVPVAKHQGGKLDILKPVSKDKYKSLFEQVIDTGKIRTLIVNGETFTIDDVVSSIIIRNNLDKIAPETFVTSHILIKPGEKLQLGNGKDYYEVKANDTIAGIAKSNHMMVKELVTLNPWLADDNRIKFYQNKLILPNETSLATDTHTNHEYGDEGTRNTVAHSNKASSHNNSNHALTASDTSAHDYFADFDGGNDKFYGSFKGGDTFAGGKGNDIYYINFNGERSDTIIDSEGKNELHVIDEKGNIVRLTGGSRKKDTMPERTFVSDDGHYVFHVDEHNMLSVLRAEDVKKAGDGDFSEGMKKIIANKKTRHNASKKQPAGGYANNSGSSNTGAGNAGGNHSNTGNSGSNHADSGKNQAGNPSAVPEPKEIRVPNFGNGGFGINLKDDPQEPDPFPSAPEPAPDSTPGYGDAPRTSSPIIFDLNGDGVTTVAKDSDIIRFDLDNNGFAERTGWVNKYDGLLVRDLNGNGRIDNGGELFGNYTKLANGQMAANGFEALNDLDDNQDGQITAADTAWKTLRIWQDTNQDAHSAKGELSTLDELGITSISTKYQNSTEIDTAGNAHKQISSARRSDGSSIAVSDVWFTTHLADTSQKNKKTVSSEIALLPNIRSFGNVPDLHQAMIVNQKLKQAVETYLASNKKQRTAQIDSLIYLWTGVADVPANSRDIYIDARQLTALEALTGEPFLLLGSYPNPGSRAGLILAAEYNKFAHYVAAHLDAYGNPLFTKYQDKESGREIYDFNKLNSYIQTLILDSKRDEIANIGQIIQGLIAYDSYQKYLWQKNVHKFILNDDIWAYLITSSYIEGTKSADTLYGKASNEFINGDEGDDKLYANKGDDVLNGGAGNDGLYGEDGNDTLIGGAGNDTLNGGSGSDTYVFGKGFGQDIVHNLDLSTGRKDIIRFTDGITADMLTFTREGNHLLIKAKDGSGQVTVQYYFENDGSGAYRIDEIHFDNGKVLNVATVKALVQQSTDGSDRLYAYQSGSTLNGGLGDDYLYGADGADTLNGGKGNDWLYSGNGNDMLNGDEGDDKLYANHGDDVLNGGAGNDGLYGEDGNDTLIGGAGNDTLNGGSGSDTYVFGKGFGQDMVNNYHVDKNSDTMHFKGFKAADVHFIRSGSDLVLSTSEQDNVRISGFFYGENHRVDTFVFDDVAISNPDFAKYINAGNNLVQSMSVFGSNTAATGGNVDANTQSVQQPLLVTPSA